MIIAVIDTETTGMDEHDEIVEMATILVDPEAWAPASASTLLRPQVPVTPGARANHHITDAMLSGALSLAEWDNPLPLYMLLEADVLAAHNAEFDVRLLSQSLTRYGLDAKRDRIAAMPRICTVRCAQHLWQEAPGHSNQVLRYWRKLEVSPIGHPHRAMYDASVTVELLRQMLLERSPSELIELTRTPVLQLTCAIGQWRGRPWAEVDVGMLRWILSRNFGEDVNHTARYWLAAKTRRA